MLVPILNNNTSSQDCNVNMRIKCVHVHKRGKLMYLRSNNMFIYELSGCLIAIIQSSDVCFKRGVEYMLVK